MATAAEAYLRDVSAKILAGSSWRPLRVGDEHCEAYQLCLEKLRGNLDLQAAMI